jgi:O-acetyl-ADP-ribose deacetylase (regulator of RNase III)
MAEMTIVKGDATRPTLRGNKLIVHICNDVGKWGKGFVMALSARWKKPEEEYRKWFKSGNVFVLGAVQQVQVEPDIWVINMIAQHDIKNGPDGTPPIRYEALTEALKGVCLIAREYNATVHMPKIGTGLAGGDWEKIRVIIEQELCRKGIAVTVYNL